MSTLSGLVTVGLFYKTTPILIKRILQKSPNGVSLLIQVSLLKTLVLAHTGDYTSRTTPFHSGSEL